jgi:hypothetical protein
MTPAKVIQIRYLPRDVIDISRWDSCIDNSPNGLVYGRAFFLDMMTGGQWDALVMDDYAAIMPLTWRRKAGIRYLYQPPFTQQTGIFSPEPIPPALVSAFLEQTQRHFRFAEIFLNFGNFHPALTRHVNFILSLDAPYTQISANYQKTLHQSLKRTQRFHLDYVRELELTAVLQTFRKYYGKRTPHVRDRDYRRFAEVCLYMQERGQLVIRGVKDGDRLVATALLLRDKGRLSLLQATTALAGRHTEANHYLLDQLIGEWAGSGHILDFEGSDLPGIAHFFKKFGSIDEPYYFYRYNRLPWPLRLLKSPTIPLTTAPS